MDRQNLPPAAAQELVSTQHTFNDEAGMVGPIALPHDIDPFLEGPRADRQGVDRRLLVVAQPRFRLQLANEPMVVVGYRLRHGLPAWRCCAARKMTSPQLGSGCAPRI